MESYRLLRQTVNCSAILLIASNHFTLWAALTCQLLCQLLPVVYGVSPAIVSVDLYLKTCCGIESKGDNCLDLFENNFASDIGANEDTSTLRSIYIGGLFPLSDSTTAVNGRLDLEAACLALNHVNEKNVLEGYQLVLYFNDTQVGFLTMF